MARIPEPGTLFQGNWERGLILFSSQWYDVGPLWVKRRLNRCDQRFELERLVEHDIVAELALEARPVCVE